MESSIEMDPRVCAGKPVIRGTRIPVAMVLEQWAENESWESLLRGYRELTRADIRAALHYAKDVCLRLRPRLDLTKRRRTD